MKATTECFIGLRNVGDKNDKGTVIHGTLKDGILEIARFLGSRDMKSRFQISVGRNESDAKTGLRVKGDPSEADMSLMDDLESILNQSDLAERAVTDIEESQARFQDDDYQPELGDK